MLTGRLFFQALRQSVRSVVWLREIKTKDRGRAQQLQSSCGYCTLHMAPLMFLSTTESQEDPLSWYTNPIIKLSFLLWFPSSPHVCHLSSQSVGGWWAEDWETDVQEQNGLKMLYEVASLRSSA